MASRLTPEHFRMARAALLFDVRAAKDLLGVSYNTLWHLEQDNHKVRYETEETVRLAYEGYGVRFVTDGDLASVQVDLKKVSEFRSRLPRRKGSKTKKPDTQGDEPQLS
jgi:hypothetical protein